MPKYLFTPSVVWGLRDFTVLLTYSPTTWLQLPSEWEFPKSLHPFFCVRLLREPEVDAGPVSTAQTLLCLRGCSFLHSIRGCVCTRGVFVFQCGGKTRLAGWNKFSWFVLLFFLRPPHFLLLPVSYSRLWRGELPTTGQRFLTRRSRGRAPKYGDTREA